MKVNYSVNLPPMIHQQFNKYLLMDFLDRSKMQLEEKIMPLSKKKIRDIDIGRKREFEILLVKFKEVYERKKNEKTNYEAALKEKAKERSSFPTSGGVCRFRRMETKERTF